MPAFFFISGYCSNFEKNIRDFFVSLLKGLVFPLFVLSILNDICYALLISHEDIFSVLINTVLKGGTLWFIQALIIAKILCYLVYKSIKSVSVLLCFSFVFLFLGVLLHQYKLGGNPFYYQHGLVASFFVSSGLFLKKNTNLYEGFLRLSLFIFLLLSVINSKHSIFRLDTHVS